MNTFLSRVQHFDFPLITAKIAMEFASSITIGINKNTIINQVQTYLENKVNNFIEKYNTIVNIKECVKCIANINDIDVENKKNIFGEKKSKKDYLKKLSSNQISKYIIDIYNGERLDRVAQEVTNTIDQILKHSETINKNNDYVKERQGRYGEDKEDTQNKINE